MGARQSISIDVLYNIEFKSDDEVNISAEDKDVDDTIATDDHYKDFSFCHIRFLTNVTNALRVSIIIIMHHHQTKKMLQSKHTQNISYKILLRGSMGGPNQNNSDKKILLRRHY